MSITVFGFMDTRYQRRKKGRDEIQQKQYQQLHQKIALILQKHPKGLYRADIRRQIDVDRMNEGKRERLTLVTLRKHINDFKENEKLVIETDINPADASKMARRKLFWAFQHQQFKIIYDLLRHHAENLENEYNEIAKERNGNLKFPFAQLVEEYLRNYALVFLPIGYQRSDGRWIGSYFLYSLDLKTMDQDPVKCWQEISKRMKVATKFLKNNPDRKVASDLPPDRS